MRQALPPGYGQRRARRAIGLWLALGALAWVVLPWYLPQDLGLGASLARAWGGAETASALVQVGRHGRPWLLAGALGLLAAALAWRLPTGRAQGAWLVGGTASALLVLLGCGFAIGAQGWAFESLGSWLGSAPRGQPGIGLGGALVLAALLVLLGMGLARLGSFHGDLFVGASVVACGALLALFIVLPVGKALVGAPQCSTQPCPDAYAAVSFSVAEVSAGANAPAARKDAAGKPAQAKDKPAAKPPGNEQADKEYVQHLNKALDQMLSK
mgnify:CR=1 FL=1